MLDEVGQERTQARQESMLPRETPGVELRKEVYALIAEVRDVVRTLPAAQTEVPELQRLAMAAAAGPGSARAIIETAGGAAVANALMQASATFRSTGHFANSDLLERLAFVVAGWERRVRPRKR